MNLQPSQDPRLRILFITPMTPFAAESGSQQRSAFLLAILAQMGTVDVVQLEEGQGLEVQRQDQTQDGRRLGGGVWIKATSASSRWPLSRFRPNADLTARLRELLPQPLETYALVLGRYLWPLSQIHWPPAVAVVADLDDWRFRFSAAKPWRIADVPLRARKWLGHRLARRELPRLSGALAVSAQDELELASIVRTHLLPNVPRPVQGPGESPSAGAAPGGPHETAPVPGPRSCGALSVIFVGAMWYWPNAEAVSWMIERVWPTVHQRFPAARLRLLGPGAADRRQNWERTPGVQAPGFVEDLQAEYRRASVVVVPMLSGGGSNIKAIEAMAHGCACVVSDLVHGAFGQHCRAGRDYRVHRDAQGFAEAIIDLLKDPEVRIRMGEQAQRTAERAWDREAISRDATAWLRSMITHAEPGMETQAARQPDPWSP